MITWKAIKVGGTDTLSMTKTAAAGDSVWLGLSEVGLDKTLSFFANYIAVGDKVVDPHGTYYVLNPPKVERNN